MLCEFEVNQQLHEVVGMSIANTSQHLQQLRCVGLVTSQQDCKFVLYSLADAYVDLMGSAQKMGFQDAKPQVRKFKLKNCANS